MSGTHKDGWWRPSKTVRSALRRGDQRIKAWRAREGGPVPAPVPTEHASSTESASRKARESTAG